MVLSCFCFFPKPSHGSWLNGSLKLHSLCRHLMRLDIGSANVLFLAICAVCRHHWTITGKSAQLSTELPCHEEIENATPNVFQCSPAAALKMWDRLLGPLPSTLLLTICLEAWHTLSFILKPGGYHPSSPTTWKRSLLSAGGRRLLGKELLQAALALHESGHGDQCQLSEGACGAKAANRRTSGHHSVTTNVLPIDDRRLSSFSGRRKEDSASGSKM
eukprot:s1250_g10.t1